MSDNLYDALEACIDALQRGEDIESCLARYPRLVDELRPLLAAAADASSLAVDSVPAEVARRGKARFLNAAAELREHEARGGVPAGGPSFLARFRRSFLLTFATVTAVLVAFLLLGSVGLVSASSAALPGDPLYRVKTSWEDLRLQLASSQAREALQDRYDEERVDEVDKLLERGRAEDVEFSGTVTALSADHLVVSGITVFLTDHTQVEGSLAVGAAVKVEGLTRADGTVVATQVKVLGSPGGGEDENGGDHSGEGGGSGEDSATRTAAPDNSGEGSGDGSDDNSGGETPSPDDDSGSGGSTPQAESFDLEGKISQLHNNSVTLGGVLIMLDSGTEIRGTLAAGATVRARGVITSNGTYRATRVEVLSTSGGSATATPTSSSGGGGSGGGSATATATSSSGGGGGDGGGGGGGGGGDDGGGDGG